MVGGLKNEKYLNLRRKKVRTPVRRLRRKGTKITYTTKIVGGLENDNYTHQTVSWRARERELHTLRDCWRVREQGAQPERQLERNRTRGTNTWGMKTKKTRNTHTWEMAGE